MHGSTDDLFLVMIMGADYHYSVISVIIIRSFNNVNFWNYSHDKYNISEHKKIHIVPHVPIVDIAASIILMITA